MLGWQIGVLVMMIVVFLVGVAVLSYLLYRFGGWGSSSTTASSSAVLTFIDHRNQRHTIDLKECDIVDAAGLFQHIARLCGLSDHHMLALYPIDSAGDVERAGSPLSMDSFLKQDADFLRRVQQTVRLPLLLGTLPGTRLPGSRENEGSRLREDGSPEAAGDSNRRREQDILVEMKSPAVPALRPVPPAYTAMGDSQAGAEEDRRRHEAVFESPYQGDVHKSNSFSRRKEWKKGVLGEPLTSTPLPPPLVEQTSPCFSPVEKTNSKRRENRPEGCTVAPLFLFPSHHHIDTRTAVTIEASEYVIDETDGTRSYVDAMATRALDKALFRNHPNTTGTPVTVVPRGGTYQHCSFQLFYSPPPPVTANHSPLTGDVRILLRENGEPDRVVRRYSAATVLYTIDDAANAQWRTYRGPLNLPPGRWCLRAKSFHSNGEVCGNSSRVYAVEVARNS